MFYAMSSWRGGARGRGGRGRPWRGKFLELILQKKSCSQHTYTVGGGGGGGLVTSPHELCKHQDFRIVDCSVPWGGTPQPCGV